MENFGILYADEVLSSSPEEVLTDDLDSLSQTETCSNLRSSLGVKRKRDREKSKEEIPNCELQRVGKRGKKISEESSFGEDTENINDRSILFSIDKTKLPDICSLYNTVAICFSLQTCLKFVDLSNSHFSLVPSQINKKVKNGIWLRLHLSASDQAAVGSELFLLIELYERHFHREEDTPKKDQLVSFCGGKCGKKKQDIIFLQEKMVHWKSGFFEAIIAINEQCAHRSDNEYGSPNTRFYFKLQLLEKTILPDTTCNMRCITNANSTLIKVVAPGKSKQTLKSAKKATIKPTKMTMKQMMETFLLTVQNLEDRLNKMEKRMEEIPSFKQEPLKSESESDVHFSPQCVLKHESIPSLRRSCDYEDSPSPSEYLSLSQEINFLIQDPGL